VNALAFGTGARHELLYGDPHGGVQAQVVAALAAR
jgi:hypothetical protein